VISDRLFDLERRWLVDLAGADAARRTGRPQLGLRRFVISGPPYIGLLRPIASENSDSYRP
jgi:hypothetical protein